MFVDSSGALGLEHARDLHGAARIRRMARAAHAGDLHRHTVLEFLARGQLGPVDNYRVR